MSRHRVKFDGGKFSVLCDGVIVLELPMHQETEQLRAELAAARDAERDAANADRARLQEDRERTARRIESLLSTPCATDDFKAGVQRAANMVRVGPLTTVADALAESEKLP